MPTPDARPQAEQTPLPRGQEKIDHDLAMARLAAEIHLRSERYAKRSTRKFVSASTTEYAWAGYLRAWVDRVRSEEHTSELQSLMRSSYAVFCVHTEKPSIDHEQELQGAHVHT